MPQGKRSDLTNLCVGRLIVIGDSGKRTKTRGVLWECLCECNTTCFVQTTSLLKGRTKSCGCLQRDHIRNLNKNSAKENGAKAKRPYDPDAGKKLVYEQYLKNARGRGYCFYLTYEQCLALFSAPCHYCGDAPSNEVKKIKFPFKYNGIDRLRNDMGYFWENVVSCCKTCNMAKRTLDVEEFLSLIWKVAHKHLPKLIAPQVRA